jgi:hypothetical protein
MPETDLFLPFTRGFESLGLQYMVSGSVASGAYGEPRFTNDVDLVVDMRREDVARLPNAFPADRFYLPPAELITIEVVRRQRGHINLVHHESGFKADVYLRGRDPLNDWAFPRARARPYGSDHVVLAPPEYVIVRKLEFFREGGSEKHVRDIQTMCAITPDIDYTELDRWISAQGLESVWRDVRERRVDY